jgi:nitrite reductase/ring-hydroxylating ferredoxin subunit
MSPQPLDRREFLRRASLTAGTLGLGAAATPLAGCGDSGTAPPAAPAAPSSLDAMAQSASEVRLTWIDNAAGAADMEVERRAALETVFTRVATLPPGTTEFADTGLGERTLYTWRVRAVQDDRASAYSNEASATTPAAGAPLAPTDLLVEFLSGTSVRLRWNDRSTNEAGFRVERRDGTTFTTLATVGEGIVEATLENLGADELYRVRVLAANEAGDSAPSAEALFFTGAVATGLTTQAQEPGRLRVTWTDRTGAQLGFRLERDAGAGFESIATTGLAEVSFDDTTFPTGASVRYRVMAAGAAALESEGVEVVVPAEAPGPAADLVAALSADNGSQIVLSWSAEGATGATGFEVQRKLGTSAFSRLHIGDSAEEVALQDTPGMPFLPANYRVRAWNLAGYSAFSNESAVVPRAVFFIAGALAVLNTVNKAASVQIPRPSASVGSSCFSPVTNIWLVRVSEQQITAVVAHCTHECLTVPSFHWNESQRRFFCAHGSQFDANGVRLQGPAKSNVPTLPTEIIAGRVEILPPVTSARSPLGT